MATLALLCFSATNLAQAAAQDTTATVVASEPAGLAAGTPLEPQLTPGLNLKDPVPKPAHPSLLKQWWFWTAVGAVAAVTVAVIVASSRGQAPPATVLGNQEFAP